MYLKVHFAILHRTGVIYSTSNHDNVKTFLRTVICCARVRQTMNLFKIPVRKLKFRNSEKVWNNWEIFQISVASSEDFSFKDQMFWEGHKILQNLHLIFACKYCKIFVAFSEYMNFNYGNEQTKILAR